MAKPGNGIINIYGSAVTGATNLYVYLFKGNMVLNTSTEVWEVLPITLSASYRFKLENVPNNTNPAGVAVDFDFTKLKYGQFDLVYMDGIVYLGGIRVHVKADGEVVAVPE